MCNDSDGDGCDDCALGAGDAPGADGRILEDGLCNAGDTDADGDGVDAGAGPNDDQNDADATICNDSDGDGCDDCSEGNGHPARRWGHTLTATGCDGGDTDADGDGVNAGAGPNDDSNDADDTVCNDSDGDTCDDCALGAGDAPGLTGLDLDTDGLCDAGDLDGDGDGVNEGAVLELLLERRGRQRLQRQRRRHVRRLLRRQRRSAARRRPGFGQRRLL